ncbi:MAG: hypothetical protein SFY81_10215, partial [Verrucomicrobiota bacterium]|nr:hypothetical protein [Verrucomicrobiota bacterium]
ALEQGLHGVCVASGRVAQAYAILGESEIKVTGLVGFPYGDQDADVKRFETEVAIDSDAHEIEVFLNHGHLKDGEDRRILRELSDIVEAADERPVKAVVEMRLLPEGGLERVCKIIMDSGAQMICLGTGLNGRSGNSVEVDLVRARVGEAMGIKVGGIKDFSGCEDLVRAVVTRLGIVRIA